MFSSDTALLTNLAQRSKARSKPFPVWSTRRTASTTPSRGQPRASRSILSSPARLGFTPTEVAEDATAILDGLPTANPMIVNGRPYTVRVRLPDESRTSLDTIQNTVFNSSSGHTASLGSLAQVTQLPPQNEILRENLQTLISVTGRLDSSVPGADLGTAMQKVQAKVASLHIPSSVRIEYGGTYQEQQKSFQDLLHVLILALALVFGVLLAEFRNFSAPLAILTSSVLSISGVVLALLITQTNFNVASFMGLIMVIGIVAKNGILLLDADEKFRARADLELQEDPNAFDGRDMAREAMLHAAQRRLAANCDDCDCGCLRNASAGVCTGCRIADAAAAGDCRHWRIADFGRSFSRRNSGCLLPADEKPARRRGRFSGGCRSPVRGESEGG